MTKLRKKQAKRQESRAAQAAMHDKKRLNEAMAEYDASPLQTIDSINERIRIFDGPDAAPEAIGPDYKKKKRQKSV